MLQGVFSHEDKSETKGELRALWLKACRHWNLLKCDAEKLCKALMMNEILHKQPWETEKGSLETSLMKGVSDLQNST